MTRISALPLLLLVVAMSSSCAYQRDRSTYRVFSTSFESVADFGSFYISPQNQLNSASHELSTAQVHGGVYSHRAWIYGPNPESTILANNNHRGYPTIQFQKTAEGVFLTPCYVTFHVWLDMALSAHSPENQWFSFATLTTDSSDAWNRTILVNMDYQGNVHLMHVPYQGQQVHSYQDSSQNFPQREWVEIRIYLDTRPGGYAKVWVNGKLVSQAGIADGNGVLAQAHFGLYAAPSVASGEVYNDDLEIREVAGE